MRTASRQEIQECRKRSAAYGPKNGQRNARALRFAGPGLLLVRIGCGDGRSAAAEAHPSAVPPAALIPGWKIIFALSPHWVPRRYGPARLSASPRGRRRGSIPDLAASDAAGDRTCGFFACGRTYFLFSRSIYPAVMMPAGRATTAMPRTEESMVITRPAVEVG